MVWVFILTCLAALTAGVLVPRVTGGTPYTILTGSMTPTYPPGTLVVDKAPDPDSIGVGTVVTYQITSGEPTVVTHRVTEVNIDLTGSTTFTTQGDANPVADQRPVRPEQIRGQVWYAVPYLGRLNVLFSSDQRQLFVNLIAGALALYAGLMILGGLRDRRRRSTTATPTGPTPRHDDTKEEPRCIA